MASNKRTLEKTLAWQRGIQYAIDYDHKVADTESYGNFFTLNRFAVSIEKYISSLSTDHIVLDLGTGTGAITNILNTHGLNSVGLDVSADMLAIQKQNIPSGTLLRGSVFKLPFKGKSFDAVIARWVLGHFPDWLKIVVSIHGLLKDGGFLIFDFANEDNLELAKSMGDFDERVMRCSSNPADPDFIALCPSRKLKGLLEHLGFVIEEMTPCGVAYENYVLAKLLCEKYPEYVKRLETIFRTRPGRDFLNWLDAALAENTPLQYARRMLVVARKETL